MFIFGLASVEDEDGGESRVASKLGVLYSASPRVTYHKNLVPFILFDWSKTLPLRSLRLFHCIMHSAAAAALLRIRVWPGAVGPLAPVGSATTCIGRV